MKVFWFFSFFALIPLSLLPQQTDFEPYFVRAGDSYWKIAKRFRLDYLELMELNGKKPLRAGALLRVPVYFYYPVKSGDTLIKLARRYQVPLQVLLRHNAGKELLLVGKQLKIPRRLPLPTEAGLLFQETLPNNHRSNPPTTLKEHSPGATNKAAAFLQTRSALLLKTLKKRFSFAWPLKARVEKQFGVYDAVFHSGLLMRPTKSLPVRASEAGQVVLITELRGFGKTLFVMHEEEVVSVYAGVSNIAVQTGARLQRQQRLGTVKKNRPFFFSIFIKGHPEDPTTLLGITL